MPVAVSGSPISNAVLSPLFTQITPATSNACVGVAIATPTLPEV